MFGYYDARRFLPISRPFPADQQTDEHEDQIDQEDDLDRQLQYHSQAVNLIPLEDLVEVIRGRQLAAVMGAIPPASFAPRIWPVDGLADRLDSTHGSTGNGNANGGQDAHPIEGHLGPRIASRRTLSSAGRSGILPSKRLGLGDGNLPGVEAVVNGQSHAATNDTAPLGPGKGKPGEPSHVAFCRR